MLRLLAILPCALAVTFCASRPVSEGPFPPPCGQSWWWTVEGPDIQPGPTSGRSVVFAANQREVRAVLSLMIAGAELHCVNRGSYPATLDEMVRYGRTLNRRARCAVADIPGPDPWGTPYLYHLEGGRPYPFSAGPDRTSGTSDDLGPPDVGAPGSAWFDVKRVCGPPS
jgi:hypothetical protein